MPPSGRSTTIRGAVALRRDQQGSGELTPQQKREEDLKAQIRHARNWFDVTSPSHVDADQFVNLCLGALRKDWKVMRAAAESPVTFMQAANECAHMGLVPGKTYYFTPFRVKVKDPGGKEHYENQIVGMIAYQGALDLIYRAGAVTAVHAHVIRENDTFKWRPGEMDIPYHVIHAPDGSTQEGLADDDERGQLTGVYAYAKLISGGFSQPVVMSRSEVKKHRDVARTDQFWGPVENFPPASDESRYPYLADMFRKTAILKMYNAGTVPTSTEYRLEQLRVASAEVQHRDQDPVRQVEGEVLTEAGAIEAGDQQPAQEQDA